MGGYYLGLDLEAYSLAPMFHVSERILLSAFSSNDIWAIRVREFQQVLGKQND